MDNYAELAINAANRGKLTFCKFLSANDTGLTGGHQSGIYISKPAVPILFDKPCEKGANQTRWVKIKWQDGRITDTRFIYYGQGTRNEYRITNFGRGFEFLKHEYTGALFVFVKMDEEDYEGYVLNTDEEINAFLEAFNISPTETNSLVSNHNKNLDEAEKEEIYRFVSMLDDEIPSSNIMSAKAREIENLVYNHAEYIITDPDRKLVNWDRMEFKILRAIEHVKYGEIVRNGFPDVEAFIAVANKVLNSRKSRAGKSLENHLINIFDVNKIEYTSQAITEGKKKPDFIFPSQEAYRDFTFPTEKLISLAAKTTCKDRWRQILNEADRLRDKSKFLCTYQQGISSNQIDEMEAEKVILVVPKEYIGTYPKEKRDKIWTVKKFVDYVKEMEGIIS